jgi:Ciliary rootlet component, centrosome cohesion
LYFFAIRGQTFRAMKRVSFKVSRSLISLFISFCVFIKSIFDRIFQLPGKEPTSIATSRVGEIGGADKKKPFTRPFTKTRLEGSGASVRMASPTPNETNNLLRQNQELRQRLQEESSGYRRRLDTYKQAQSNQSALVSRLQAKVLQYKQRCSELETQMVDTAPLCPQKFTTTLSTTCPSKVVHSSSAATTNAPLSMSLCPELKPPVTYCSDESDESFERKKIDEERKL